jgi:hypothetical protein
VIKPFKSLFQAQNEPDISGIQLNIVQHCCTPLFNLAHMHMVV